MPKATQLSVSMPNKVGALAQLCSTLARSGVNISAMLAPEITGRGRIRLLVDNVEKAKDALKEAKIRFSEEEVLTIDVDNTPGSFGNIARKLAQFKINIKYAYSTAPSGTAKATVVLGVSDVAKAIEALRE
jgi:hypothetical protein